MSPRVYKKRTERKPQRRFQVLPPSAHCCDPGCDFAVPGGLRLDKLVDAALDHIHETSHFVSVAERSQVIYGPPKAVSSHG